MDGRAGFSLGSAPAPDSDFRPGTASGNGTGMKLRNRLIPSFLVATAMSCGVAHAEDTLADGRSEVSFRPWIGSLGVRFPSENLFEETTLPRIPDDQIGMEQGERRDMDSQAMEDSYGATRQRPQLPMQD